LIYLHNNPMSMMMISMNWMNLELVNQEMRLRRKNLTRVDWVLLRSRKQKRQGKKRMQGADQVLLRHQKSMGQPREV